MTVSVRHGEII